MDSNHEVDQVPYGVIELMHVPTLLHTLTVLRGLCNTRSTWLVKPGEHHATMEWHSQGRRHWQVQGGRPCSRLHVDIPRISTQSHIPPLNQCAFSRLQ
jgi:hypothetical protein